MLSAEPDSMMARLKRLLPGEKTETRSLYLIMEYFSGCSAVSSGGRCSSTNSTCGTGSNSGSNKTLYKIQISTTSIKMVNITRGC